MAERWISHPDTRMQDPVVRGCRAGGSLETLGLRQSMGFALTDLTFGLYLSTQFPPGDDITVRLSEARQQVVTARDEGFGSVWAGSHYLTYPMVALQPVPLLARLIPDTGTMTIGTNILVLPLLNPAAVAEESATLQLLSGGRYVL